MFHVWDHPAPLLFNHPLDLNDGAKTSINAVYIKPAVASSSTLYGGLHISKTGF